MNIHIIVTGGTFDKEYNELNGELYFKNTHLPEMLSLGRSGLKTEIQTLMMVDSLQMTPDDRARIVECCRTVAAGCGLRVASACSGSIRAGRAGLSRSAGYP